MSVISWFKFENKDLDFPAYNNNPHIPKIGWFVLLFAVILGILTPGLTDNEMLNGILGCVIILVPLLYYLKWDYKAIFQKPKAREVGLALALFAGYIIYSTVVGFGLEYFSLVGTSTVDEAALTFMNIPPLVFSLMCEELIKLIPFLLLLRVFYKYSNNRKLSVIASMFLVMIFFGCLHLMDLNSLPSVILMQGFGSIFEFYGYIKTKNLFIPYITHLTTDVFLFLLIIFNVPF